MSKGCVVKSGMNGEKYLFYFVIVFIFLTAIFKNSLTSYPFNFDFKLRYIDDIIILTLFSFIGIDLLFGKVKKFSLKIIFFIGLFFLIYILQVIYLKLDILKYNFIFFIRDNFCYFPVFYFVYKCRDIKVFKKYENLILCFIFIQVLFVCFQFFYSLLFGNEILFADKVNGSLGANASHKLSYSLMLVLPYILQKKKLFYLISILFIVLIASARSAILFFAFSLIFYFLLIYKTQLFKKFIYGVSLFLLFTTVYWVYSYRTPTTLNPKTLFYQQRRSFKPGRGANRLIFVKYTIKLVKERGLLFFGGGPGSYASRTGTRFKGYLFKQYEKDFPYPNEYISGGSSLNVWIGEMGIIGCLLFIFMYVYILLKVIKVRRIYILGIMPFILGFLAQKLNEAYMPAFMFWLILGVVLNTNNNKADTKEII